MGRVIELRSHGMPGAVGAVAEHRLAWRALSIESRLDLLDQVMVDTAAVAARWVAAECERKRIGWGSPAAGEEWSLGPLTALRVVRQLRRTLRDIERHGHPRLPGPMRSLPDGRALVRVYPADLHDRLVEPSLTADLLIGPTPSIAAAAGPYLDVIGKLFAGDRLAVLKLAPGTEALAPVFGRALGALIDGGFVRIGHGGASKSGHLPEASGALGVTPVIVVPDDWSRRDLEFQAKSIATMLARGGGYDATAARLLITDRRWSGREELLAALRRVLHGLPNRFAFHPGARERFARFVEAHPERELIGAGPPGSLPWALVPAIDPSGDDTALTTDPFAPILSETALDAPSPAAFVDAAVRVANERVSGGIAASLIVHPRSLRDPGSAAAVGRALAALRHRTVVVNGPPFLAFDCGAALNTWLLNGPEQTIVRAPFRPVPDPPWLVTHRHAHQALRRLTAFETDPRLGRLPPILWDTLKG